MWFSKYKYTSTQFRILSSKLYTGSKVPIRFHHTFICLYHIVDIYCEYVIHLNLLEVLSVIFNFLVADPPLGIIMKDYVYLYIILWFIRNLSKCF